MTTGPELVGRSDKCEGRVRHAAYMVFSGQRKQSGCWVTKERLQAVWVTWTVAEGTSHKCTDFENHKNVLFHCP